MLSPTQPGADRDLLVAGARFDAFVSYRRIAEDTAFVDGLQAALAGRGRKVWVDRAEIEPASDWSERIARGIEAARAFILVITPESVASQECRREYSMAVRRNKLVVPVVLRDVRRQQDLPEGLARLNWIFFSGGHDFERALGQVIAALEEDLGWRDAHTRLGVRAAEWAGSGGDKSLLLRRGRDLGAAEEWLGQATQHEKTPPTALQTEYILASRKDAVRTQRTWRAALVAGLVVSLALAAVAYVQRNDARSAARQANSRAEAAEATADLSSDPEQSLALALSSMQIDPNGPGEQAMRLALAQDRLRMAISTGTGPNTLAAWNGRLDQVAVTAPHDSVALWNAATGRLIQVLPTGHAVNQLLYDPSGSRLAAVSSAGYLTMWNLSASGVASPLPTSQLNTEVQALTPASAKASGGPAMGGVWANDRSGEFDVYSLSLPELLAFVPGSGAVVPVVRVPAHNGVWAVIPSPDGSRLFVNGFSSGSILDLATGRQVPLSASPGSPPGPACWFPDGSEVVTSSSVEFGGAEQIYRAASGVLSARMQTPASPTTAVTCSANAADDWVAAGDEAGNVILRLAGGTVVRLFGHSSAISAIVSSPDGRYLATASIDGTARIWDASTGQEVTDLDGDGAPLIGVQFGPADGLVLTVDERGFVRIWDTGLGQPVTTLQQPAQGQAVALGFARNGQQVVGAGLMTSTGPASQVTSASALTWNAQTGRLVRQVSLPGIADAGDPCSPTLKDDEGSMGTLPMLNGSDCGIPPPPNLILAVTLPRPQPHFADFAVIELLPLAISPDAGYIAYGREDSVALLDSAGRRVAALNVDGTATGLSFFDGSAGLLVMTDSAVYLWRPFSGSPPLIIRQESTPIDAAVSESGGRLAVAGGGTAVSVWDTASGRLMGTFVPPPLSPHVPAVPLRVVLTADGDVVASGNSDGTVSLWNVATGKRIKVDTLPSNTIVAGNPVVELGATPDGSRLVAVDYPEIVSGVTPPPAGEVLDASTGRVLATYSSPEGVAPDINPGAALSADGSFLLAGANGLAPTPPGGTEAAYQVSSGQAMATLPAAGLATVPAYSESPAQPWSPDDTQVIAGSAIYSCDACGLASTLETAAASRLAWSQPLSQASDHPPLTTPYG